MNIKKTLLATACAMTVFLSACGSDNDNSAPNVGSSYIGETSYNKDSVQNADNVQVMRYKMNSVNNKVTEATALVLYPKTQRPQDGWRVVVWEHGTVGSGDSCAPSVNSLNPRFKSLAEDLLAKGYVIVAPDYEGLGTAGIHPYLHLSSAANSAIYAVKAFADHHGAHFKGHWVSVGQSQGGHASLATAELASVDKNYKAAVAAAPASHLGFIIGTFAPQALRQLVAAEQAQQVPAGTAKAVYAELLAYAAYVVTGVKAYNPQFDYESIFQEPSKFIVAKAEGTTGDNGLCLTELMGAFGNDIDAYLQANPGKNVADYPGLIANFEQNPVVKQFLKENQPGTKRIFAPVMIIQGESDMAVPVSVTDVLQFNLQVLGTDVKYERVPNAGHTQAIVQRQAELIAFIEEHMPAK